MATQHPVALLPMQQRTNFSYDQPSPLVIDTSVTYAEVVVHATGMTSAAMSLHFWVERSTDGGVSWLPWQDSGVVQGGFVGDKSGVLGDATFGFAKSFQPNETGALVQIRSFVRQVGTFRFDANATYTTEP